MKAKRIFAAFTLTMIVSIPSLALAQSQSQASGGQNTQEGQAAPPITDHPRTAAAGVRGASKSSSSGSSSTGGENGTTGSEDSFMQKVIGFVSICIVVYLVYVWVFE